MMGARSVPKSSSPLVDIMRAQLMRIALGALWHASAVDHSLTARRTASTPLAGHLAANQTAASWAISVRLDQRMHPACALAPLSCRRQADMADGTSVMLKIWATPCGLHAN